MTFSPVLTAPHTAVGADLDAWLAVGGGRALAEAIADPVGALTQVRDADLRGMGGAGFPTHQKWAAARRSARAGWVVANGNEDEPGTFKDRWLLTRTPHAVIEGALVAAVVTGAAQVVIYVSPHHRDAVEAVQRAVVQWRDSPVLARVPGPDGRPPGLVVTPSDGQYVSGEETAVIAAIEGRYPFPRRKPPHPTESGVHGAPTVVNNVETLAHVGVILRDGVAAYRALGRGTASGPKLYSLSGDVLRPGLYELPMGVTLLELVFDHGGGMLLDRPFKAVFTGGPSNTLLTAADLDVPLDFDSVAARGSRLGTGAMIVVSSRTGIVRRVADYVEMFADASCGQCPPCRTGTRQMDRLLRRIDTGAGTPADLAALRDLCELLPGSGRCGLVDAAVAVVASSLEVCGDEYAAQLRAR